jgi:hypothetical protein
LARREARFLILVEKWRRKSTHGGGDQEKEPKNFERTRDTALNKPVRNFIALLLVAFSMKVKLIMI